MKRTSGSAWIGLIILKRLLDLRPTAYPGLCEAHVHLNGKTHIFYTGPSGDFFLMGQLYDSVSGRNVTRETIESVTFFSPEEMNRLAELAAFTIGQQGKLVYYATDPQCPYCKKGVETLQKLAAAGEIQVRFLLYPLASHKGAREQSISTLCDRPVPFRPAGRSRASPASGADTDRTCSKTLSPEDALTLAESNQEDCLSNRFPTCGDCLWTRNIIVCPWRFFIRRSCFAQRYLKNGLI